MIRNLRPPPKANPAVYNEFKFPENLQQQQQTKDPSNVRLSDWKREGYPSEYAYAQAMGVLDMNDRKSKPVEPLQSKFHEHEHDRYALQKHGFWLATNALMIFYRS